MRIPVGDVTLNVEVRGDGPPLVLLHGFTGSAANWAGLQEALSTHYRVMAVDLLGHGQSDAPADPERYRIQRGVEDLLRLLDRLGAPTFHLLGYSMGGRMALHVAAARPGRVRSLILESTTAGLEDPREREERRRQDEALARFIEEEGMEAFVRRWEALPLFASQQRMPEAVRAQLRRQRLDNRPQGLAGSLRGMGTGVMPPLWDRLPQLTMPVLVVAGERDEKYTGIARRLVERLPRAELAIAPGAGHNVHLEAGAWFRQQVTRFLTANSLNAGSRAEGSGG